MPDNYKSIEDDATLDTPEKKQAERDIRRQKRIDWVNEDISGMTLEERIERLEALLLGYVDAP